MPSGLSRSTNGWVWFLICCLFLGACVDGQDEDRWCGNRRLESGDLVVLSTDFSSSSVDVARPRCEGRWSGLLVGPGDLALRWGTSQFYVLDRSTNGSITAIDQAGDLRWQTALETCGAHDLIEVSEQWGVISCYDDHALRFIRLETGEVSMGPSLLSEADSDGIPEMDRLALVGAEYLVVSIQRLGRADGYRPMASGRIVRGRMSFESDAPPRWVGRGSISTDSSVTALEVDGLSHPWVRRQLARGRKQCRAGIGGSRPLGVSARSFSAPSAYGNRGNLVGRVCHGTRQSGSRDHAVGAQLRRARGGLGDVGVFSRQDRCHPNDSPILPIVPTVHRRRSRVRFGRWINCPLSLALKPWELLFVP